MKNKVLFASVFVVILTGALVLKSVGNSGLKDSNTFGAANIYNSNKSFANGDIKNLSYTPTLLTAVARAVEEVMTPTAANVEAETADIEVSAAGLATVGGAINIKNDKLNNTQNIAMANLD